MEKALEKIKEIIDFCDAVGCHRAIYESIKFVEKELEEAIKTKTCEGCKHIKGIKPKLGQTYCAIGIEDLNYDLGVKKEFYCNRYEPKDK